MSAADDKLGPLRRVDSWWRLVDPTPGVQRQSRLAYLECGHADRRFTDRTPARVRCWKCKPPGALAADGRLAACPFCGNTEGNQVAGSDLVLPGDAGCVYAVFCAGCHCEGPPVAERDGGKLEAARLWNARAVQ